MTEPRSGRYVAFDQTDLDYFGCRKVIDEEHQYLTRRRRYHRLPDREPSRDRPVGLAFSGGGIRSSSFCLGVMQALAERDQLKRVDYLSTVSGGTYIGTTLSWLLSQSWKVEPAPAATRQAAPAHRNTPSAPNCHQGDTLTFGVDRARFPLASGPMERPAWQPISGIPAVFQGRLLAHLRQNGSYLTPGSRITLASLLTTLLRNAVFGFSVVGGLIAVAFLVLAPVLYWPFTVPLGLMGVEVSFALLAGLGLLGVFGAYAVLIGPCAAATPRMCSALACARPAATLGTIRYSLRHWADRWVPVLIGWALVLLALSGLKPLLDWLDDLPIFSGATLESLSLVSVLTLLFGLASSIAGFFASNGKTSSWPKFKVFGALGAGLLFVGFWLGLYSVHVWLEDQVGTLERVFWGGGVVVGLLLLARWTNLNLISLHRYYRDRLMETFMPWVPDALKAKGYGLSHPNVNACTLAQLRPKADDDDDASYAAPLHLINTHVVLARSEIPKFKQRGGDNFVFSALYSGSNATGWVETAVRYTELSLASVMAMSGAAVNPDAGFGGEGPTRRSVLAWLMRMLNFRLGYWVQNPKWGLARNSDVATAAYREPTMLCPGLGAVLGRSDQASGNQDSNWIEITDGGHFENSGVYELLRRRCRFIIAADAGDDSDFNFADLNNLLERARADFGVRIEIDGRDLIPLLPINGVGSDVCARRLTFSNKSWLLATIFYENGECGHLLFITTVLTAKHSADVVAYQRVNPDFPDQTTADQCFDERQFEAYRELAFQSTELALADAKVRAFW